MRDIATADVVIVAVKPQSFEGAADELWLHLREEQLVISIMAGITLRALCRRLGVENVVHHAESWACSGPEPNGVEKGACRRS